MTHPPAARPRAGTASAPRSAQSAPRSLADRNVILVKGRVAFEGEGPTLLAQPELLRTHLGV